MKMHYRLPIYEFLNSYEGVDTNVHFPANIILSNINVNSKGKITATYGCDDEEIIGNFILASFPN